MITLSESDREVPPGLCDDFDLGFQPLTASGMLFCPSPLSKSPQSSSHPSGNSFLHNVETQISSPLPLVVKINTLSLHSSGSTLACSEFSGVAVLFLPLSSFFLFL